MKDKIDITLFSDRLKQLMEEDNWTSRSLAEKLHLSHTTVARYANGEVRPKTMIVLKIAEIANVNFEWLIGISDDKYPQVITTKAVKIPVLGKVVAGIPIEAVEEIIDYEEISPALSRQGEYFALQIKGNSMEPKFSEGDVVIVRKQSDVDNGDIAIVLVNGDEATVKKIKKFNGGINLIPTNPSYDVLTFTNEQIKELPVRIIGKVVELRAKF